MLCLLLVPNVYAGTSEAGAIFLIIFPGSRPNGMGAVFTPIADDAVATYYNDAGLGFQTKKDVSLMHANWLPGLYPGMYYEFLSYVHPIADGVLGGHILYITTGETVGTDENGIEIGRWTTWDAAIKMSYGTKINKKLSLGIGAKFIYSFLAPGDIVWRILHEPGGGKGSSWAIDAATLYVPNKRLQIGLSLQNMGPNISYIEQGKSDPLPWTLRFGLAWHVFQQAENRFTIAGELTKIVVGFLGDIQDMQEDFKKGLTYIYHDTWKGLGAEYVLANMFSVRAGYFCDEIGQREGITYGGGINLKGLKFDIGIDAALYDFKTSNYRFSLGYSF
ncbi:MAG: PorV/PorQ family protein [Candidatus Stahlbacteria bacterium]|nr:PorV/PorQ family protein [Candidatus Stahlbacteria bacterium]